MPICKLEIGTFTRNFHRLNPATSQRVRPGGLAERLRGLNAAQIRTLPNARPAVSPPLFPFKVFQPLAVNHLTAVSPMQP
jgi:hypothetical protein